MFPKNKEENGQPARCESAGWWEENFLENLWPYDEYHSNDDDRFHQIYRDILRGNFMGPFLLWLKSSAHCGSDPRTPSVPIPAGLPKLHPDYSELINFIGLDQNFLDAATTFPAVSTTTPKPTQVYELALQKLTPAQMRAYLSAFLRDDSAETTRKLRTELRALAPPAKKPAPLKKSTFTSFNEIEKCAEALNQAQLKKSAEEKEIRYQAYLKKLTSLEGKIWLRIDALISERKPKAYDQAVNFLWGLRHLFQHRNQLEDFFNQINLILKKYPTLTGLSRRIETAELQSVELDSSWNLVARDPKTFPIDLSDL